MLIIRLPFYIWGNASTEGYLMNQLLGEKIASGDWLYVDIITRYAPFEGLFYGFMDLLFGRSIIPYHILGFVNSVVMCWLFNELVNSNHASVEQSFVPGLMFGLVLSISPELYVISPLMISITFFLLIISFQFRHLEFRTKRDEKILSIGIFFGIAYLFYQPSLFYIICVLIVFILFSRTLGRRYFMMIYGVILLLFLLGVTYLLKGEIKSLLDYFIYYQWQKSEFSFDFTAQLWVLLSILVISLLAILLKGRFSNLQTVFNQTMFLWMATGVLIFLFYRKSTSDLLWVLIPIAFYMSHLFTLLREGRWRKVLFFLVFISIIGANLYQWLPQYLNKIEQRKNDSPYKDVVEDRKVLVLDENFSYYEGAHHATPFFDFELVRTYFESPLDYEKLSVVGEGLKRDYPEIIIDPNGYLLKFMDYLPELKRNYQQKGEVWVLTNN